MKNRRIVLFEKSLQFTQKFQIPQCSIQACQNAKPRQLLCTTVRRQLPVRRNHKQVTI